MPDTPPGPWAELGNDLHDLAEELGKAMFYQNRNVTAASMVGKHRLQRVDRMLEEQDAEIVDQHLELVKGWWDLFQSDARQIWFELVLDGSWIGVPGGSTADVVITGVMKKTGNQSLVVIDLKTGRGFVSDPAANWQLKLYMLLANRHFYKLLADDFYANISQKHAKTYPAAHWTLNDMEMIEREVRFTIEYAQREYAPRIPGKKQCTYCKAATCCPQLAMAGKVKQDPVKSLDDKELVEALSCVEFAEVRKRALEREALSRLKGGKRLSGYAIGHTRPHPRLARMDNLPDDMFELVPVSPNKLRKQNPHRYEQLLADGLIVEPEGEPKVVKESPDDA